MNKTAAEKLAYSIKIAEINGVMGALMETELVKIASEEDYAAIAQAIAERLPEDWDMETMLTAVDEVMAKYDALMEEAAAAAPEAEPAPVDPMTVQASDDGMTDEAEVGDEQEAPEATPVSVEKDQAEAKADAEMKTAAIKLASMGIGENEIYAMFDELVSEKNAGFITEIEFQKEAAGLGKALDGLKSVGNSVKRKVVNHIDDVKRNYKGWRDDAPMLKDTIKKWKGELKSMPKGSQNATKTKNNIKGAKGALNSRRKELLKSIAPELVAGTAATAVGGAYYAGKKKNN